MSDLIYTNGNGLRMFLNTAGSKALYMKCIDPYNPLDLPDYTIRIKMKSSSSAPNVPGATVTAVQGQTDVYDVCTTGGSGPNWEDLLSGIDIVEVLGANTANVHYIAQIFRNCVHLTSVQLFDLSHFTDVGAMFYNCTALTTVPLFDTSNVTSMRMMFDSCTSLEIVPLFNTSNVTDMASMFSNCTSFKTIPLFNTAKVTDMSMMFNYCVNVESGALALYQQASSQTNPPTYHRSTFYGCGYNTETGAAELAQIPSDWK